MTATKFFLSAFRLTLSAVSEHCESENIYKDCDRENVKNAVKNAPTLSANFLQQSNLKNDRKQSPSSRSVSFANFFIFAKFVD